MQAQARYARRVHGAGHIVLLIDTCGETAGVALARGGVVVAIRHLEAGTASGQMTGAIRDLIRESGCSLSELVAVGVVSGPGSFTGMRSGLAAGKGLCEALGIPLIPVSRLEVLDHAAGKAGALVALEAGRGELYLRDVLPDGGPREFLCRAEDIGDAVRGRDVVVGEGKARDRVEGLAASMTLRTLHVEDALPLVLRAVLGGRESVVWAEANYVRQEQDIYPKAAGK